MAELLESIKSDPITYYIGLLIGVGLLCFVIFLIIKNDKKKKQKIQEMNDERARIERHVDLESMIAQMQEQEQNKSKDIDPVANFEQEQEEKAIISYQELVSAVKTDKKEAIPVTNVSSTGDIISTTQVPRVERNEDKPIFIDEIKMSSKELEFDIEEEVNEVEPNIVTVSEEKVDTSALNFFEETPIEIEKKIDRTIDIPEVHDEIKSETKFKNTEFISPIYGRQNSNITYPKISSFKNKVKDDEQVITISDDVDPNVEFLKTLREYRNND